MYSPLPTKNKKPNLMVRTFFLTAQAIATLFFLFTPSQSFAVSSSTVGFSTKIVYKADGTNITGSTIPACIIAGDQNDLCDFRIRYYTGQTGGTLRGTEVFDDIEIGQYDGLLSLSFGMGTFTAGTCTAGECDSVNKIFLYNNDVHILVDFDSADTNTGSGTFSIADTFSTSGTATYNSTDDGFAVRATPYSIWSMYSNLATTATLANSATTAAGFVGTGSTTNSVDLATAEIAGVLGIANGGTNNSTAYTAGSVIFSDGTKLTEDNSHFYFDSVNNRLGIGTSSPLSSLQVSGGIYADAMAALTASVTCQNTGGTLEAGTYSYRVTYKDGNGVKSNTSYEVSSSFTGTNTGSCSVSWTDITGIAQYDVYRRYYQSNSSSFTSWFSTTTSGTPLADNGSLVWTEESPELQGDGIVSNGNIVVRSTVPVGMKSIGGLDSDYSYKVAQDSEGNYVLVGMTSSYGVGGKDIIAAEYDKQGNLIWIKTYGGAGDDIGYDIVSDVDGSYVIVGSTNSYGVGQTDTLVLKVGEHGEVIWARTVGGINIDYAKSIVQSNDGTYFVTGTTLSNGAGLGDLLTFKMDDAGEVLWTRIVGGTSLDEGHSAIMTSDGNYVAAGYTGSFGAGGNDFYVTKISSTGALTWTKTFGGTGDEVANKIIQTPDAGLLIIGTTSSFGVSGDDIYVVKANSTGDVLWTKTFGGTGDEVGNSATFTMDGGYLIAGSTTSYGAGSSDMYLVKIDSEGKLFWTRTIGGTAADQAESVIQTDDDGYMLSGWNTATTGSSGIDIFTAKLSNEGTCSGCSLLNETPGTPTILTNNGRSGAGGSSTTGNMYSPVKPPNAVTSVGSTLGIGVYKYKVTFYTGSGETLAGNATAYITTTAGNTKVFLTSIPTQTGAVGRRIYRTAVNGDTYYMVTEIADNSTTSYDDTSSDATIVSVGPALNGIQAGGKAPNLTLVASTSLGTGTYKYLVTAYGTGNYSTNEVLLSPVAELTTTAGNRQINLTNLPLGAGSQVTGRKIYRTDVDGTVYKLLTTIADNSTTTFNDTTADGSLGSELAIPLIGVQTTFCMNMTSGSVLIAGGNGILSVTGQIRAAGNIFADTFYGKEVKLTNYDLAEEYLVTDKNIAAGDVVIADTSTATNPDGTPDTSGTLKITKSQGKYDGLVMGIVSTKPGITLTDWNIPKTDREYMRAIALAGRVPVKVTTENGPIKKGDYLVAASKPGFAMKACGEKYCESGMVIGMALESFSGYVKGDTDLVKQTMVTTQNEIASQIAQVEKAAAANTTSTDLKIQNSNGEEASVAQITELVTEVKNSTALNTAFTVDEELGEGRVMSYVMLTYYIPPKLANSISTSSLSASTNVLTPSTTTQSISSMTETNSMSLTGGSTTSIGVFGALSGASLSIGNGNMLVDDLGNLTTFGNLIVGGVVQGRSGSLAIQLAEGGKFAVKDTSGNDLFSVTDKGIFGGNAVKRSGWIKIPAGGSVEYAHNLSVNDISVELVKAVELSSGIYTLKGAGTDYYWQIADYNRIEIFNTTSEDINVRVKVTGWEDLK